MAPADWTKLKVLTPRMNWGEPDRMDFDLVNLLDEFCEMHNLLPLITTGTQGKHLVDSQHYLGKACDVMFPKYSLSQLPDVYLRALGFLSSNGKHFGGLGIYNQWKLSQTSRMIGGMHFDMRLDLKGHIETWVWTERGMLPLTFQNLTENFK